MNFIKVPGDQYWRLQETMSPGCNLQETLLLDRGTTFGILKDTALEVFKRCLQETFIQKPSSEDGLHYIVTLQLQLSFTIVYIDICIYV